jgi:hypothetical protein
VSTSSTLHICSSSMADQASWNCKVCQAGMHATSAALATVYAWLLSAMLLECRCS